jgi:mono/diheme cytochrome c family protein
MKMHTLEDDGTGYKSKHVLDLVTSSDPNFRPVDMEFAPDGSLYMIDWHNVLIGHMQHNARDPLRDHVHGKIYRITYPSRPLVKPALVDGASIEVLLDNLKLPEFRTRYRTRRELRGRDVNEVYKATQKWVQNLDANDPNYQHNLLEAMWVTWGINKIDEALLNKLLVSNDLRVRAAAVKTLRYVGHQVKNQTELLVKAASDPSGRVRLEAMIAGTWLPQKDAQKVLSSFENNPIDDWMKAHYDFAKKSITGIVDEKIQKGIDDKKKLISLGEEIYNRDGFCATCHQPNGTGLESSNFPPLAGSKWVMGNKERLIKIVLHGLYGPIEVNGKKYPGNVPMTPYGGMLNDDEIAAVLNYTRTSFGNTTSDPVLPAEVKQVRDKTKNQNGFYTPDELLKLHPHN